LGEKPVQNHECWLLCGVPHQLCRYAFLLLMCSDKTQGHASSVIMVMAVISPGAVFMGLMNLLPPLRAEFRQRPLNFARVTSQKPNGGSHFRIKRRDASALTCTQVRRKVTQGVLYV